MHPMIRPCRIVRSCPGKSHGAPSFSPCAKGAAHGVTAGAWRKRASAWAMIGAISIIGPWWSVAIAGATETVGFSAAEREIIASLSGDLLSPARDPTNRVSGHPDAIAVGRALFFDKRLSGDSRFSCASCHRPASSWGDGKDLNNLRGTRLTRNTPALWNLAWSRWYFWDGRADTLWSQALGPIESDIEQAGSRVQVARLMLEDSDLHAAYLRLFGAFPPILATRELPVSGKPVPDDPAHPDHRAWIALTTEQQQAVNRVFANTGKLIAAFEETIVSRNSPFDRFAEGLRENDEEKRQALSPTARRGLKLFVGDAGCVLCHSGPNFSDSEFHGVFFSSREGLDNDRGRYAVIPGLLKNIFNSRGPYSDAPVTEYGKLRYVYRTIELRDKFKTPSLRNAARTAPYMHTGEMPTLEAVVDYYSDISDKIPDGDHRERSLKPLGLTEREKTDLVEFLRALTDESFLTNFSHPESY